MVILQHLLEIAFVLALPIAVGELVWAVLRLIGPPDFWRVPGVTLPAKLMGVILGVVLLAARYDPSYFDLHYLFIPESPWNLPLSQFLAERVNPLNYGIGPIVQRFATDGAHGLLAFGSIAATALLVVIAAAPFRFWTLPIAPMAVLAGLGLALLAAYLTIYLVCLVFWTLHLLNFWSLAILIVLFQYYRSRA